MAGGMGWAGQGTCVVWVREPSRAAESSRQGEVEWSGIAMAMAGRGEVSRVCVPGGEAQE